MRVQLYLGLLVLSTLLSACFKEPVGDSPRLPMSKMIDVMVDVQLAEVAINFNTNDDGRDSLGKIYYAKIFALHQISREDYEQSFSAYVNRPREAKTLFTNVAEKLKAKQAELK